MRYFWGFVQLQDMLDNAIIEMKTGSVRALTPIVLGHLIQNRLLIAKWVGPVKI